MSSYAAGIVRDRYAHTKPNGEKETWAEIAKRVAWTVLKSVDASDHLCREAERLIRERKFIPGGRYLAATGRAVHQTQNCLLLRAEDTREGWAELLYKSGMALMTGAGIGVVYSDVRPKGSILTRTGGVASGPIELMKMLNECGRGWQQGGHRRSAIWAGLHWNHADVFEFIALKDWSPEVRALKEKDFDFPAPMDGTNISVILDDAFFDAFQTPIDAMHTHAHRVYWAVVRRMLETGEPGFSVDVGENAGENLRNAPICAGTSVLTAEGYKDVADLVGVPSVVWTGRRWATNVLFKQTSDAANVVKVRMTGGRVIRCDETHPFLVERYQGAGKVRRLLSVDRVAAKDLSMRDILHVSLPEHSAVKEPNPDAYTLGYVYGDGSFCGKQSAEVTFCTDASKECLSVVERSSLLSSVTRVDGRGFSRAYLRASPVWFGRSKDAFPLDVYGYTHEDAAAFLAGLFDADGNWEPTQKRIRLASKHEGFLRGVARLLEQLGIVAHVSRAGTSTYGQAQGYQLVVASEWNNAFAARIPTIRVRPELTGCLPYRSSHIKVISVEADGVEPVYCADVGVEEHSFCAEGVIISNCTEVTSRDDSDICNIGSINVARISSPEEMRHAVDVGTAFLLAGTVYSDVPYPKVSRVREKNRRLGLGVMGLHEWLVARGKPYAPDPELGALLDEYAKSGDYARTWAHVMGLSEPVKTRAIAPNGTIGIAAETTTSGEPIFAVALKRRYLKNNVHHFQYIVDPTAKRLIENGADPSQIEDAYTLAQDVERRLSFQAWLQGFVDHGISSTINLPAWGSEYNNEGRVRAFGETLYEYLPRLRGITCYPDGARGGQPLTPVPYEVAIAHEGEVFIEAQDVCEITKAGSCG